MLRQAPFTNIQLVWLRKSRSQRREVKRGSDANGAVPVRIWIDRPKALARRAHQRRCPHAGPMPDLHAERLPPPIRYRASRSGRPEPFPSCNDHHQRWTLRALGPSPAPHGKSIAPGHVGGVLGQLVGGVGDSACTFLRASTVDIVDALSRKLAISFSLRAGALLASAPDGDSGGGSQSGTRQIGRKRHGRRASFRLAAGFVRS